MANFRPQEVLEVAHGGLPGLQIPELAFRSRQRHLGWQETSRCRTTDIGWLPCTKHKYIYFICVLISYPLGFAWNVWLKILDPPHGIFFLHNHIFHASASCQGWIPNKFPNKSGLAVARIAFLKGLLIRLVTRVQQKHHLPQWCIKKTRKGGISHFQRDPVKSSYCCLFTYTHCYPYSSKTHISARGTYDWNPQSWSDTSGPAPVTKGGMPEAMWKNHDLKNGGFWCPLQWHSVFLIFLEIG